jgi:hypothetical protein
MAKPIIDPKVQKMMNEALLINGQKILRSLKISMLEDGKLNIENMGFDNLQLFGLSELIKNFALTQMYGQKPQ